MTLYGRPVEYSLVCPFLTDDPVFARGVEIGMLFSRMQRRRKIRDYFLLANQEQITLLANRLGWRIQRMEPWGDDWFHCVMARDGDHA